VTSGTTGSVGAVPCPSPLPLAACPTPLQPMDRLGAVLGFAPGALTVKRDDLTGLAGGGNKARKLSYLVADAKAGGCDVLVTAGAAQSNHVRLTAAAARMAGLDVVAVLGGERPEKEEGNLILGRLFGLEPVWVGAYDAYHLEEVLAETAVRLRAEGRRPYEIPLGGASPVGTMGYVVAADELATEAPGAVVYTATGTGGPQAGLVVGFGHHGRVRGVDVGAVPDVAARIDQLIAASATLARRPPPDGRLQLDRSQIGEGYATGTDAAREAMQLAAHHEGLVLDPVYSARGLAGLIADRRADRIPGDHPVVFLHTGGLPSLFTQRTVAWLTR
jgi:1-aminocyclopropane-1-carboxylate deaminase/D-cysteine desulfhydrase-like pyridoxal-dependent ACC family enzyme